MREKVSPWGHGWCVDDSMLRIESLLGFLLPCEAFEAAEWSEDIHAWQVGFLQRWQVFYHAFAAASYFIVVSTIGRYYV